MASFLAKIGGKCGVERDKIKIIITFRSYPTRNRKLKKKTKKLKKKISLWLHFKPIQVGKEQEREKIKIIVSFRSYTTCNRKFQKKQQKNSKN